MARSGCPVFVAYQVLILHAEKVPHESPEQNIFLKQIVWTVRSSLKRSNFSRIIPSSFTLWEIVTDRFLVPPKWSRQLHAEVDVRPRWGKVSRRSGGTSPARWPSNTGKYANTCGSFVGISRPVGRDPSPCGRPSRKCSRNWCRHWWSTSSTGDFAPPNRAGIFLKLRKRKPLQNLTIPSHWNLFGTCSTT